MEIKIMHPCLTKNAKGAIALTALQAKEFKTWLSTQKNAHLIKACGFSAQAGALSPLPNRKGAIKGWLLGLGDSTDIFALAAAAEKLPPGIYQLQQAPKFCAGANAVLGWLMGSYRFERYKNNRRVRPKLVVPIGVDDGEITKIAENLFLARDLVNTPANDMGPLELESSARTLAHKHGAKITVTSQAALDKAYPLVAAVGRGSERPARMIKINWGKANAPAITIVGKGVCFDSGGYDLKPSAAMSTMKKDMGGAACAMAVAGMVMGAKLNLRLTVLIPAVENSVSGLAMRPGDVYKSRKGLTVEIGNTDAEGRLILADALSAADEENPQLLIDIATLTGAARAATGMELPPFFTDDEQLAADLMRASKATQDPLWRLPLWRGYESTLNSSIADINNNPAYNYAGAITAALFLNRFVSRTKSWVHLDIPAWIDRAKPGRPVGGEANGARALYFLLKERYGR